MAKSLSVKTTTESFPKRRIIVELYSGLYGTTTTINKDENQVEVQVDFDRAMGGLGLASIRLINISEDTIKAFSYFAYGSKAQPDIIRVYAGYETIGQKQSKIPLLYEGNILYAAPTTGRPDRIFQIQAMEQFVGMNQPISYSCITPKDILSVIKEIIEAQGLSVDMRYMEQAESVFNSSGSEKKSYFEKTYKYTVTSYSYNDKLRNFLTIELVRLNKIQFVQEGGVITLFPSSIDMQYVLSKISSDGLISIGADGADGITMVGIPEPSFYGVKLRVIFNTKIVAASYFLLNSVFFSEWNKFRYQIINCRYSLRLREQEFYIYIDAIRSFNPSDIQNLTSTNQKNASDYLANVNPQKTAQGVSEKINSLSESCIPAIVKSYDAESNKVVVTPAIKYRTTQRDEKGEPVFIDYPDITVPVERMGGDGLAIIVPIVAGTTGWLQGADRNTHAFLNGTLTSTVEPSDLLQNKWNFGRFVPDIIKGFTLNSEDAGCLSIQTLDGTARFVLDPSGEMRIVAPKGIKIVGDAEIDGDLAVTGDVKSGTVSLPTHVHSGVTGGTSNTGQPVQ